MERSSPGKLIIRALCFLLLFQGHPATALVLSGQLEPSPWVEPWLEDKLDVLSGAGQALRRLGSTGTAPTFGPALPPLTGIRPAALGGGGGSGAEPPAAAAVNGAAKDAVFGRDAVAFPPFPPVSASRESRRRRSAPTLRKRRRSRRWTRSR